MLSKPPDTRPPNFIPSKSQSHSLEMTGFGIDDSVLRLCMFNLVYIWFRDGLEFWAWLTFIGGGHTIGWRWDRLRWIYFEIDLRKIENFICYK